MTCDVLLVCEIEELQQLVYYPIFKSNFGSFPFAPPVRYASPVTDNVSLHGKSLWKNAARASGLQIICTH